MYDFVVVGGGIAGLACAELLQRSGRNVLLVEAADRLCGQASAQQQGWFHTGALYAALPARTYFRQLIGNLDDLFNYYAAFPGMNLASGRYLLTRTADGWFKNQTSYYAYVSATDSGFRWWQRPLWQLAILRAQTRLSWFETVDFTRELSPQVSLLTFTPNLNRCLSRRSFEFDLGPVSKVMKSRDRTFDAPRLIADLLGAFLAAGGEVRTGAEAVRVERERVHTTAGAFRTRNVVVAAGHRTESLTGIPLRIVRSPLLVVRPALADVNFIRMTPNIEQTFNHLHHVGPDGDYSLIGNARFYEANTKIDEAALKAELIAEAARVFGRSIAPEDASLYFGVKAEATDGPKLRNYQYQILESRNAVAVLPGKMSLAFSLAVNLCRHFGIDPATDLVGLADPPADLIAAPEHARHAQRLAEPSPGLGHLAVPVK